MARLVGGAVNLVVGVGRRTDNRVGHRDECYTGETLGSSSRHSTQNEQLQICPLTSDSTWMLDLMNLWACRRRRPHCEMYYHCYESRELFFGISFHSLHSQSHNEGSASADPIRGIIAVAVAGQWEGCVHIHAGQV